MNTNQGTQFDQFAEGDLRAGEKEPFKGQNWRKGYQQGYEDGKKVNFLKQPMGVSQWEEHGKLFGYWQYFERKIKNENNKN